MFDLSTNVRWSIKTKLDIEYDPCILCVDDSTALQTQMAVSAYL